jgi:hypothetical protein
MPPIKFPHPPAVLIYNIYIEVYILYNKTYKYTYLFAVQGGENFLKIFSAGVFRGLRGGATPPNP